MFVAVLVAVVNNHFGKNLEYLFNTKKFIKL